MAVLMAIRYQDVTAIFKFGSQRAESRSVRLVFLNQREPITPKGDLFAEMAALGRGMRER